MNLIKATIATAAVITCCMGNEMPAKAQPLVNDYTIGKALKDVKCGRRDMASTSLWLGQMGVTNAYLSGPAMQSVEFHKGYKYGSRDC